MGWESEQEKIVREVEIEQKHVHIYTTALKFKKNTREKKYALNKSTRK